MGVRSALFEVHSYEVDAFDVLAAPVLGGFLQEVASLDAVAMGCGIDTLGARGLTWVLARQRIELAAPIRIGDTVEVATWPSGVDRLFALREFRLSVAGRVVGEASTEWLVMDLASRRPVRPDRALAAEHRGPGERLLPAPPDLPVAEPSDSEHRFTIRYSDIDRNLHVTNTSYLAWALEAVPRETWRGAWLAAVDVRFLAECAYGSQVLSRTRALSGGAFAHSILRQEDGKELARARTHWTPRAA